jgi:hypothetical protein
LVSPQNLIIHENAARECANISVTLEFVLHVGFSILCKLKHDMRAVLFFFASDHASLNRFWQLEKNLKNLLVLPLTDLLRSATLLATPANA